MNSSWLSRMRAASVFSSTCAVFDVPGMGNITDERCSSQASASWDGEARCCFAVPSRGLPGLAGRHRRPRDERDVFGRAVAQDIFAGPVKETVTVLHGRDGDDRAGLGHLLDGHL